MLNEEQRSKEVSLAAIDSSGRQISLLNDGGLYSRSSDTAPGLASSGNDLTTPCHRAPPSPQGSSSSLSDDNNVASDQQNNTEGSSPHWPSSTSHLPQTAPTFQSTSSLPEKTASSRRKYHCTEPGCHKSFTTSGHLARHNRIHTGERNFHCLFPGCPSRFSRQDNMMQHYRTHMAPKSRRSQRRAPLASEELRPRPRLHAHHRIQSDPVRVEPPLTIDQHLSNYHQYLSSVAGRAPSKYTSSPKQAHDASDTEPAQDHTSNESPLTTTLLASSSPSSPLTSSHIPIATMTTPAATAAAIAAGPAQDTSSDASHLFYKHRPLIVHPAGQVTLPFTLLHPPVYDEVEDNTSQDTQLSDHLLQLAHIVSTFG